MSPSTENHSNLSFEIIGYTRPDGIDIDIPPNDRENRTRRDGLIREKTKDVLVRKTENFIFGEAPRNYLEDNRTRGDIVYVISRILKYLPIQRSIEDITSGVRIQKRPSDGVSSELKSLLNTQKKLLDGELKDYIDLIHFFSEHGHLTEIMRQSSNTVAGLPHNPDASGKITIFEGAAIGTKRDIQETPKGTPPTATITLNEVRKVLRNEKRPEIIQFALQHVKIYTSTFTELGAHLGGLKEINPTETSTSNIDTALENIRLILQFGTLLNEAEALLQINLEDDDAPISQN